MSCPHFRAIDEYLAVGVDPELLPGQHRQHLALCPDCRGLLADSLELARLLQAPLLLPPADLTARIMARVDEPARRRVVAPSPAAQERLVWAALGAAAASLVPFFQLEPMRQLGFDMLSWLPTWEIALPGVEAGWALLGATLLVAAQAALLWGVRRAEGAA